jgi:hypothetical protein
MRGVFIAGLLFCFLTISFAVHAQDKQAAAPRDPVLVTISKETTRITEPLKESGYPDFLEAVNLQAKGKVTPQTNGAVLLVRAAGPYGVTPGVQQEEFYKRLGIEPLPENHRRHLFHSRFIQDLKESELPPPTAEEQKLEDDSEQFEARRSRVELDFEHCGEHPWSAKNYPLVARWLREQEKSFTLLDKLRDYPDAYLPMITGTRERSIIAAELPGIQLIRLFAFDLNIRAMNSLAEGKPEAAIDDLERLLVLSGYLHNNKNIVSVLVSFAIRGVMHNLVNELAFSGKLTAKQIERVQKLIEKNYPAGKETFAECIDQGERFVMIESICRFAEFGPGGDEQKPLPLRTRQNLDYDLMLSICHKHYDRLAEIARIEDREKQAQAFSELEKQLGELSKKAKSPGNAVMNFLSKTKRSEQVADILMALLTPALDAAIQAGVKNSMRRDLWLLSLALEKYRRKHGQFPKSLDQLSPEFLAKIPIDQFSGKPLKYSSDGKGVLVYSVGRDLEDHGGFEGEDTDRENCDDIAIFTNDRRPKQPAAKPPRDFLE